MSARERTPLAALLLVLALRTTCFPQDNCIYRITASDCLHEPTQRTLTGFIVKGTRGIYTALHGVVDAKHIGAVSEVSREGFSNLQIIKADPELDVALLYSEELGKDLPGLEVTAFAEDVDPGPLKVIGYPLGVDLLPTDDLHLRSLKLVALISLLNPEVIGPVEDRNSPSYKAKVLSIQGQLLPGHSGAPILDSKNRVVGIANGGLRAGTAGISWAMPMSHLMLEDAADKKAMLPRLRNLNPGPVFFFGAEEAPLPVPSEVVVRPHFASLVIETSPSGFAQPLDGFPMKVSTGNRILTGGFKTFFTLRHDHGSDASIIVRAIYLDVLDFAPGTSRNLAYKIDADKIYGAGSAQPNVLRAHFRKDGTCDASWLLDNGKQAKNPNRVRNLLDVSPPVVFQLGSDSKSDATVVIGYFFPQEQGLFHLRLRVEYDFGSGTSKQQIIGEVYVYNQS